MVVNYFDIMGISMLPCEADAPLIVYPVTALCAAGSLCFPHPRDAIVREPLINYYPVIPAKAGIQYPTEFYELDSGTPLRSGRNDDTSEIP